ncbi:MFS transporter [Micromonospora sp. NPDC049679]|uniref:MFS transporter n=1 Tax=Micromonospora sp. NPDC049679 TaxID=3155920 RepID=UPI00340CABA9
MAQTTTEESDQPGAPRARRAGQGHPWLTLVSVALGVIMVALDGTVVAIANPEIGRDLGASLADLQWVTSGYLLALAVFLITAGKLGDRFGHKKIFIIGVVGFALTSLAIGLSHSIGAVVAFRVLQGLFGAMLQPTALALLRAAFPAEKLNMAIGVWGASFGVSTAAGPVVGGLLVEHVSWQSVFFINIPVGIVALAAGLWALKESKAPALARLDVAGIVLLSGAMFCLVWGIIKAPEWGWGDARSLGFFAGAAILTGLFVFWQARAPEPLVPLSLFRSTSVSIGTVLMVLVAFSMFGSLFFLTFFLQNVHRLSPVESGLRMMPMSLMMIISSPLAGALITKYGPRVPIIGGLVVTAVAMFLLSRLQLDAGYGATALPFLLLGLGLAPVMVAATDVIVGNSPEHLTGVASGVQQSAMQVGGSLGTAVLGAVMTARVAAVLPGHFASNGLPAPTDAQVEQMKGAVAAGVVPLGPETPPQVAAAVTRAAELSFLDGMHLAFTLSAVMAVVAIGLAFWVKAGRKQEGPGPVHM